MARGVFVVDRLILVPHRLSFEDNAGPRRRFGVVDLVGQVEKGESFQGRLDIDLGGAGLGGEVERLVGGLVEQARNTARLARQQLERFVGKQTLGPAAGDTNVMEQIIGRLLEGQQLNLGADGQALTKGRQFGEPQRLQQGRLADQHHLHGFARACLQIAQKCSSSKTSGVRCWASSTITIVPHPCS